MRVSKYKNDIVGLFANSHTLNIQAIFEKLGKPDFSTVFRNVEQLCSEGILKKIVVDLKTVVYELASHAHGHFICTNCKKVSAIDIKIPKIKEGTPSDITLYGSCQKCK
jgi:Fe2+ or Zn2+ uptake regulation protein